MGRRKKSQQTVATYYMGMHMVLCNAPIDSISRVEVKETLLNDAPITGTSVRFINKSDIFGGLTREGGISGAVSYLFGFPNQVVDSYLSGVLGAIPAYRGVVSVILQHLCIGTSYYPRAWRFFATRVHLREKGTAQWQDSLASPGGSGLINAVHVIREVLTDTEWGLAQPEASIDETSFASAANVCHYEGLGFSWLYRKDKTLEDFITDVAGHINATVFRDRKDNLWKITLVRLIADPSNLPRFSTNHVKKIPTLARKGFYDLTSQYLLKYDSNLTFKEESYRISDPSLAARQGKEVLKTVTFSGVATPQVAQLIARRELSILSKPVYSGTLIGDRTLATLNPGDAFVLEAFDQIPSDLVLRVVSIKLGTIVKEEVSVDFIEDALTSVTTLIDPNPVSLWTSTPQTPVEVTYRKFFESPYYAQAVEKGDSAAQAIPVSSSFVRMTAVSPSNTAIDAELWDTAGSLYEFADLIDFQFSGTLSAEVNRTDNTLDISGLKAGVTLAIGNILYIGEELVQVVSFNFTTNQLVVLRGVLDTIPEVHLSEARFIQIKSTNSYDETEYLVGEVIKAKLLTQTAGGGLPLASAPVDTLELIGRMHRPYPPGNVQIDAVSWLEEVSDSGDFTISWTSRNRLQQTTQVLVGYYEGSVTSEFGITYNLTILLDSDDTVLYSSVESGLTKTINVSSFPTIDYPALVRLEMTSENANGVSFQTVAHKFTIPALIFKAEDDITQFTDEAENLLSV